MNLVDAARNTSMLIEMRDAMRLILGDRYDETVRDYRAVITAKARESGRPVADVALDLAKKMKAAGHDPVMFFCALVEECGA